MPTFLQNTWMLLTEVPGWADAPFSARFRRMLPIALPCLGIVLLLGWNLMWYRPLVQAAQAEHAPLIALEEEIENLQMANSEQQTVELTARATQLSASLFEPNQTLTSFLDLLKQESTARGWTVTFYPGEIPAAAPAQTEQIAYLPVRAKLVPAVDNPEPFASLLALLERFSSTGKRIDLMRLAIRADENRWLSVEAYLRLACPVAHEKTTQ